MRCTRQLALHNPSHLAQLRHQIALRLQATGGVDQHDVDVTSERGVKRVKGDRARVGSLLMRDNRRVDSFAPCLQLFNRRHAECVSRR